jgi:antitoxin VapB
MTDTDKILLSGRSRGEEIRIKSHGNAVVLEPIPKDWAWLDALVGPLDEDFVRTVNQQPKQQQPSILR